MRYRCYAKVNLTLEILGRRADAFHELASLVHTINLADELAIEPGSQLLASAEGLDEPAETNLIVRAAELLQTETGVRIGAALTLRKAIPVAAGLGGGSSDAASALVGLNVVWRTRLGYARLARLAAQLGSDVPFFLHGGAALMGGRGDQLQPLPPLPQQWLVLVAPPHSLANKTARLYGELRASDFSDGSATQRAAAHVTAGQPLEAADLCNGFLRAALAVFPGLADTKSSLEARTGRRWCLSGAGPALFCLASSRRDATRLRAQLEDVELPCFVAHTVRHGRAISYAGRRPIGYP